MPAIERYTRMKFRRAVPIHVEPRARWEQRLKQTGFGGNAARTGLAFYDIIRNSVTVVPWTIEAWQDYSAYRDGLMLTGFEVAAIRKALAANPMPAVPIEVENKLEQREWKQKAKKLGFAEEEK